MADKKKSSDSSKKSKSSKVSKKKGVKLKIPKKINLKEIALQKKTIKIFVGIMIFALMLLLLDYGFQYLNNDYSAAVITHKDQLGTIRVPMSKLTNTLVMDYGAQTTESMIQEYIIKDYARREGIEVAQEEVDFLLLIESYQFYGSFEAMMKELESETPQMQERIQNYYTTRVIELKILFKDVDIDTDEAREAYEEYKELIEEADYERFDDGKVHEVNYMMQNYYERLNESDIYEKIFDQYSTNNNIENPPEYKFMGSTRSVINLFRK